MRRDNQLKSRCASIVVRQGSRYLFYWGVAQIKYVGVAEGQLSR